MSTDINLVWTLIKEHNITHDMELFIPKVQLRTTNTQNGLFLNSTQKRISTYFATKD